MSADLLATVMATLLRELAQGSPDTQNRTYVLNRGDTGLLASLERLSAEAASSSLGGASIAAHVDHLRYGFSILNRWAAGTPLRWKDIDWTASWKKNAVSEAEWRALRDDLRDEVSAWIEALGTPRETNEVEAGWMAGSVVHLGYHLGAIRQIDRAARGPTAEDEARAEAALRAR